MTNKIDLSCIVGSQVLCEFSFNNGMSYVSFLKEINSEADMESARVPKYNSCHGWADNCRIYQHPDYWISNAKGDLVLPDGLVYSSMGYYISIEDGFSTIEKTHSKGTLSDSSKVLNSRVYNSVQVTGVADGWEY